MTKISMKCEKLMNYRKFKKKMYFNEKITFLRNYETFIKNKIIIIKWLKFWKKVKRWWNIEL